MMLFYGCCDTDANAFHTGLRFSLHTVVFLCGVGVRHTGARRTEFVVIRDLIKRSYGSFKLPSHADFERF